MTMKTGMRFILFLELVAKLTFQIAMCDDGTS
jgi:hypothetical protein